MNELLKRALDGDGVAESELFSSLRVRFVLLAKRRLGERDAEDVAQEACITIAQKYRELAEDVNFAAWAFQVLRNKIGNCLQQRSRRNEIGHEDDPGTVETSSVAMLERRIVNCLRRIYKINRQYARVLNLVHLGFEAEEICQVLGVKRGNLYVVLSRGRQQLRKCLAEQGE